MHPKNPKSGGRVVLEVRSIGDEEVAYAAEIYTPATVVRGRATVRIADGAVGYVWEGGAEPPAWLVTFATAFLRSDWKTRRFTTRINRWREEK